MVGWAGAASGASPENRAAVRRRRQQHGPTPTSNGNIRCGRDSRDGRPLRAVPLARLSAAELDELPDVPAPLRERLVVWLSQRSRFERVDEPYSDRYAWEDEGMAIRRELQRVWGPSYHVEPG